MPQFPRAPDSPSTQPPPPCTELISLHPTFLPIPQLPLCPSSPATFPSWFTHPSLPCTPLPLTPRFPPYPNHNTGFPMLQYFPKPQPPPDLLPQYSFLPYTPVPPPLFPPIPGPCALVSPVPVLPKTLSSLSTSPYPTFPCTQISPPPGASVSKILQLLPAPVSPTHSRWLRLTHRFY